jgi:hypothetical protein
VNERGEIVPQPEGAFPIIGGPWPGSVGAMQARCAFCDHFVGISPKGMAMHREQPEQRPICCPGCYEILRHAAEA